MDVSGAWLPGGWMFLRALVLLSAAVLLCGCETERDGIDYSAMTQRVGAPRPGQARVVILREKGYGGITDAAWEIQLDGAPMNGLRSGTYVYSDRPAGPHQLTATEPAFPGVTHRDITAQAGQTYFFVARPSERKSAILASTAGVGLVGFALSSAMTSGYSNQGPFDLLPLDETAARTTIAELRLGQ
jgi:Protein of unknown function (DUF2846)